MSVPQARPTFVLTTQLSSDEVMACLKATFRAQPNEYHGRFTGRHAIISIAETKRHFWSPWMNLEIREMEAVGSPATAPAKEIDGRQVVEREDVNREDTNREIVEREVVGRFSPSPAIWTAFMFSWLAIGVVIFFAAMFGISQQLTGLNPWAYWVIPTGLLLSFLLWIASQAGQKLAYAEMEQLKSVVESCLQPKTSPLN